jgi:hypothetical protein
MLDRRGDQAAETGAEMVAQFMSVVVGALRG